MEENALHDEKLHEYFSVLESDMLMFIVNGNFSHHTSLG